VDVSSKRADQRGLFLTCPNLIHHLVLYYISLQWYFRFFPGADVLSPHAHTLTIGNQRSSVFCAAAWMCLALWSKPCPHPCGEEAELTLSV